MTGFRSFLFQLFFWLWTLILAILYLPLLILPRGAMIAASRFWSRSLFGALKLFCGLGYRVEGRENIPDGPALFAVKHQSAWDTMVMPLELPGAAVVLKRELHLIPFYGWYAKKYGTIGIDRGKAASALRHLLRDAKAVTEEGHSIIVFPEGTRAPAGEMRPFQPGIAALYRDLGLPVVPVALNSGRFWARRSTRRNAGTITLRYLEPIPPGLDRKEFMVRLESAISDAQAALDPPG